MKKKRGDIVIQINLSNHWVYLLVTIGIISTLAIGVYAYGTSNPSSIGHSIGEINWSSGTIAQLNVTSLCLNGDCRTSWI